MYIKKLTLVDTTDNNRVLGTIYCDGRQECENGYKFVAEFVKVVKE